MTASGISLLAHLTDACAALPAGPKVTQLSGGLAGIAIPCHVKITARIVRDN
mgnify:CR=1 FL=1